MTISPDTNSESSLLDHALAYAQLGWAVLPLKPRSKLPLTPHAVKDATTDAATLRAWWGRWPDANIGIACGSASGVTVVDLDNSPGRHGVAEWAKLTESYGPVNTVASHTGGGGNHLFFRLAGQGNSRDRVAPGIEIRGDGLYVVAPPSIHPSGTPYTWISPPSRQLADLPAWLIPAGNLEGLSLAVPAPAPTLDARERCRRYLLTIPDAISGAGGHPATLRAACECFRFGLQESEAWDLLNWYNATKCFPAWSEKELRHKLREGRKLVGGDFGKRLEEGNWRDEWEDMASYNKESIVIDSAPELKQEAPPAFPSHLLNPPGVVGELCRWINETAIKPQPVLALANSLAFFGAVIGRKVRTPTDLRSNLYCLGVGESGCGKDHSRKAIKKICAAANLTDKLLGGEEVSSDSAILAAVAANPTLLFQFDEIGHMISQANSKFAASHQKNIVPTFTRLFSSAATLLIGKQYAGERGRTDIEQPNACIYGTGTPGRLYDGITRHDITDGFLGRILIFTSNDPDPAEVDAAKTPPPQSIVAAVGSWFTRCDLPRANPDVPRDKDLGGNVPITVDFDAEADSRFRAFALTWRESKAKWRDGSGLDVLWSRAMEHARKLAMVVAAGCEYQRPTVTGDIAAYATELVDYLVSSLIETVKDSVSNSDFGRERNKILKIIKDRPRSRNEIARASTDMHPNTRKTILDDLVSSGTVVVTEIKTKGRPKTVYSLSQDMTVPFSLRVHGASDDRIAA